VVFGGVGAGKTAVRDTWEFDGSTWFRRNVSLAPRSRSKHAMADDPLRQRTVLFGGVDNKGQQLDETWEWDGSTWQRRESATVPRPAYGPRMAYHGGRGRVVMLDYWYSSPTTIWEWDGRDWTPLVTTAAPPGRVGSALAYDAARDQLVVFGGYLWAPQGAAGDTWILTNDPARTTMSGPGCGPRPPSLDAFGRPSLGNAGFGLDVQAGPAAVVAWLVSSAGASLPLGSGCVLRLDPAKMVAVVGRVNGAGFGSIRLGVPLVPGFAGTTIYAQAGVADPAAPRGFALSGDLQLLLGW